MGKIFATMLIEYEKLVLSRNKHANAHPHTDIGGDRNSSPSCTSYRQAKKLICKFYAVTH